MCQSKENGGRRCTGRNPLASNYPAFVRIDKKNEQVIIKASSFADRPALALHAAVLSARSGYPLSPETIEEAQKVSGLFNKIPKSEIWEQWNDLALAQKPSAGLQAIHDMGWEKNFPELAAIRGVPQSPIWHPEGSVEIHSAQAGDVAAERARVEGLNESDTRVAVMGAICHDFGKAVATHIHEDGKISSAGHDDEGYPLAISFLERIGASKDVQIQVPLIVREHMCHTNAPSPKSVRKLMRRLANEGNGTTLEAWARVAEADRGGRGSASTFGISKEWLKFKEAAESNEEEKSSAILSGALLRQSGCEDFRMYKTILQEAKEAQDTGEINNEDDAREWLVVKGYLSR